MRLTEAELVAIKKIFLQFKKEQSSIYLFGSRTDIKKKGGDIDLLVTFESQESLSSFQKLDFIVDLKKTLGDRKIDITLATNDDLKKDEFLISILDECRVI